MPCDASHCEPTRREIELGLVRSIEQEFLGLPFNHKDTTHLAYNKSSQEILDYETATLCSRFKRLTDVQIKQMSLEAQMWWRDHQEADREREQHERKVAERERKIKVALAKLTPEERHLLGYM